jgi:hypothetical protein
VRKDKEKRGRGLGFQTISLQAKITFDEAFTTEKEE